MRLYKLPLIALGVLLIGFGGTRRLSAQADRSALDSARFELNRGRAWHAARLLRAQPDLADFSPDNVLLLARAEAGWRDFRGVTEALRGRSWLAELSGAEGLYLLGLAEAEMGDSAEAARLLLLFESLTPDGKRRAVARSRLAVIQAEDGQFAAALNTLERMSDDPVEIRAWTALEVARSAAKTPDVEAVRRASTVAVGEPGLRAWALEAEALVRAGDSTAAILSYRARLETLVSKSRRAWALMSVGRLLVAAGDEEVAREAFESSLEMFAGGSSGRQAAAGILQLGLTDAELSRRVARVLASGGDARRSVEAYERHFDLLESDSGPGDRLAWARQLSAADRKDDAVVVFRELVDTDDPELALRVLDTWVDVRRAQGRADAVRTIQGWILERFPESAQAAEIHFYRGDDLQDRGVLSEAALHYQRSLSTGPHAIAGLSWMRAGQIALGEGMYPEAIEIYDRYMEEYPDGRRWDEAAFWGALSRAGMGDSVGAKSQWESILARYRTSYYSVLAAAELGRPFGMDVPESLEKPAAPEALVAGLRTLDLFRESGLDEAASWWVARLRENYEEVGARMALAEALIERGYSVEGIRIGQALLSGGETLDRRLLEIIYPFPFRGLIMAEAAERNVDPFLIAGLIRQESAFDADIVSRAGAIGLMQVMPATGGQLARAERIRGFTPESLETAEINVHLGLNFWTDLERAFSGTHLPLRLSAYNAGPTRARRWRGLPENVDPLRFTERIPFEETRGYVKNVSRNAALYRAIYDRKATAPAADGGSH